MRAIITGITGQDGAYLAKYLLDVGYSVIGVVRNIYSFNQNRLKYLGINGEIKYVECDLSDAWGVLSLLREHEVDEFYNLASQSSVGRSFTEPISTLKFNTDSVLNILEAVRITGVKTKFYQASSSEMYGSINDLPITESSVMHPVSPYAISKATAYWMTICYRESYGIFACNGILFNHESYLRGENFFLKKVITSCLRIKNGEQKDLVVGNLDVKRDFGYAPDYVIAMHKLLQLGSADDIVISSGKSVSLRELVYHIFDYLKLDKLLIKEDSSLFRPNEIDDIYGDNAKAKNLLKWNYQKDYKELAEQLIEEEMRNFKI